MTVVAALADATFGAADRLVVRTVGQARLASLAARALSRAAGDAVQESVRLAQLVTGGVGGATSAAEPTRPRPARPRSDAGDEAAAAPRSQADDSLGIPDYDMLAASQVVSRLSGLAAPELEAVRQYESATRGRKTILSKIAQLQAG